MSARYSSAEEWLLARIGELPQTSLGWFRAGPLFHWQFGLTNLFVLHIGVGFYNKREFNFSIECFKKATQLDPLNYNAYQIMARACIAVNSMRIVIYIFYWCYRTGRCNWSFEAICKIGQSVGLAIACWIIISIANSTHWRKTETAKASWGWERFSGNSIAEFKQSNHRLCHADLFHFIVPCYSAIFTRDFFGRQHAGRS